MNNRGFFITLDGIDGTGKSTQCRLLADWLRRRGHAVTECIDPGGTQIGAKIRAILLDSCHDMSVACEMFLFMASRVQLVEEIIRPALEKGRIVIADRFLLANVVYQGHAGGLNVERLWSIGNLATGGLAPDLTVVLDMPVDVARQRLSSKTDRMESRDADFHERVRAGFLAEAQQKPNTIRVVDACQEIEAIAQQIQALVEPALA